MKCIICNSENIELKDVNEEFHSKNDIICVKINVSVCLSCGERYYDRKTMKYLEEIQNKVTKDKTHLSEIGKVLVYND